MSDLHDLSGEKKEQLLILTDKKGNQTGSSSRESCHQGLGKTHLAFMALIIDRQNNLILARRSKNKTLWALFWDASVVSHVLHGETVIEAANRRGKEEMGVDLEFKDIGAFYYFEKFNGNSENEYCHVLIGTAEKDVEFNPVEIDAVRKIRIENLLKEIRLNPGFFTPWLKIAVENKRIESKLRIS